VEQPEKKLDWGAIYRRLEQTERALDQIWRPDEERQRRLIEARDRRLEQAQAELSEQSLRPSLRVIEFRTAGLRFAVEFVWVQRVQTPKEIASIPATPPFIHGLAHILGRLILAVDLQKFFGLSSVGLTNLNQMIVVKSGALELGFLADQILGERNLPPDSLLDHSPAGVDAVEPWRRRYAVGVTSEGVTLLSVEKILADVNPGAWATQTAEDHS
jgi:chemotaxis signal transduction protein